MGRVRRLIPFVSCTIRMLIPALLFIGLSIQHEKIHNPFQFLCILLAAEAAARCVLHRQEIPGAMILVEIFLYQTCAYSIPGMIRCESLFIALGMLEICFDFPLKASIIINLAGGVYFCSQSSLFQQFLEAGSQPAAEAGFPFYCFTLLACSVLCCLLSVLIDRQDKLFRSREREETIYKNLEAINRTLSEEMFSIKAESEQKAKKEVTKYIHDNVGYVLTNLTMMLQATNAVNQTDKEQGQAMLERCISYSHSGLEEIRMFLRNIQKNTEGKINLQQEIMGLAKLFEKCTGTEVVIEFGTWPGYFTKEINSFFLSFVKECLTNAVKHGMASHVLITCNTLSKYMVGMSISSNGKIPAGPVVYGLGLRSIQDAVQNLGGKMRVSSTQDSFIVSVSLPFVTMESSGTVH